MHPPAKPSTVGSDEDTGVTKSGGATVPMPATQASPKKKGGGVMAVVFGLVSKLPHWVLLGGILGDQDTIIMHEQVSRAGGPVTGCQLQGGGDGWQTAHCAASGVFAISARSPLCCVLVWTPPLRLRRSC